MSVVWARRSSHRAGALAACVLAVGLAAACSSVQLAAPVHRTRLGPAATHPVVRVVALPATCGALTVVRVETDDPEHPRWEPRRGCSAQALQGIDTAIRSGLEFAGFGIIDSARVNAVTGARQEIEQRWRAAATTSTLRTTEVHGATFDDATPLEQVEILRELGAQGLLNTRISVGAAIGAGGRRLVVVQLQLLEVPGRALVWARRCELEVGGLLTTDELAMERAARCAVDGIGAR